MISIDKAEFEKRARYLVEHMKGLDGSVFSMLAPELVCCDASEPSVTLAFPASGWERNPGGEINGGVSATMIDTAMGTLTHAVCGKLTPTVSLSASYQRPAPGTGRLMVKAVCPMAGRSLIFAEARLWGEAAPDKIAVTAQGVFKVPSD